MIDYNDSAVLCLCLEHHVFDGMITAYSSNEHQERLYVRTKNEVAIDE